ncbi:MAG: GNAT family N-acetyltransferase [Deltaproteobacteria bacterium]|nr:GNAT family N-acetyltransferase [Deltaproteobacteria bacterium]
MRVAPLRHDQLGDVVTIHTRAFADSAITAFGAEAIRRYYLWLLDGPHDAVLTGAWRDHQLVGFCAAGIYRGAMNGFLRANRRYLALRIATHPWLALSPMIRDRLKSAIKITMRYSRIGSAKTAQSPPFGVLSIATDPAVRGSGAGRALMLEAEQRARAGGHPRMLLTVHPDNTRAVTFYEQLGWQRVANDGPWSGQMERLLSSSP